jgi:hypothetical protein
MNSKSTSNVDVSTGFSYLKKKKNYLYALKIN